MKPQLIFHKDGLLDPPWMTDGQFIGIENINRSTVILTIVDVLGVPFRVKLSGVISMVSNFTDYNIISEFYCKRLDEIDIERCFESLGANDELSKNNIVRIKLLNKDLNLVEIFPCAGGGAAVLCHTVEFKE